MFFNTLALTAGLAATAAAFDCSGPYFSFYNRAGNSLVYDLLDPAISPGTESGHLHSFDGGNGLLPTTNFADTQGSTCTTARVKTDKSLYWRPTLYWNGNNTGFYRVPDQYLKIYYKFGDSDNTHANVTAFPDDFKMIAGNSNRRAADGNNPGNIQWECHGGSGQSGDTQGGFPKGVTSCPDGFAAQITFPSCWNGNAIDPKNPDAHMAWPTLSGKGIDACPTTHRQARFPSIFIEFWYDISGFDGHYSGDSNPWVLSNGDPTGYGFHADFTMGWEKGVLDKAIAAQGYCNCGCGCGNDQMKTCFGAENVNDDDDADFKSCSVKTVFGVGDTTFAPLQKLPGCNPIQSGPSPATAATGAGCSATPAPNSGSSNSTSGSGSVAQPPSDQSSAIVSSAAATKTKTHHAHSSKATAASVKAQDYSVAAPGNEGGYGQATSSSKAAFASVYAMFTDTATDWKHSLHATPTALPVYSGASAPAGSSDDCTPTIYETVTNTATVTVPAAGGYRHKRHPHMHKF